MPVLLPFWGEWIITQAHHGEFTHKQDWGHAWDFEIQNEEGLRFKNGGKKREDYYAYDKPVVAPADGWVEEILDGIDDNEIGDSNLEQNWGNTIVIKHSESLYTKISHLKKNSFKVHKGDFVKKGEIVANCGNSGRSPEPHIHFQIQASPFIGSKTLDYPLGHYITHSGQTFQFKSYSKPKKDETVSNISKNTTLYNAFHFVPGQYLKFQIGSGRADKRTVMWEVRTDIYNNTFLYCLETKSKAWFKNDGSIHYFTHYEGKKDALLFYFYLAAYKVIKGFYKGLKIKDIYPVHMLTKRGIVFLQDFVAPFYVYIKSHYEMEYIKIADKLTDSLIEMHSRTTVFFGTKQIRALNFQLEIESNRIKKFVIKNGKQIIEATELSTSIQA
jgi:hypothetical protein